MAINPIRVRFTAIGKPLRPLAASVLERELLGYTKDFAEAVREAARRYPPPVLMKGRGEYGYWPRTYTLYHSWQVYPMRVGGVQIGWQVYNDAHEPYGRHRPYAAWVHGSNETAGAGQTWFHASHGWIRIDTALAIAGSRRQFRRDLQVIISAELSKTGLM